MLRLAFLTLIGVFSASWWFPVSPPTSEFHVSGQVLDHHDRPQPGAVVFSSYDARGTVTDHDGRFELRFRAPVGELLVMHDGFRPDSLFLASTTDTVVINVQPTEAKQLTEQRGSAPAKPHSRVMAKRRAPQNTAEKKRQKIKAIQCASWKAERAAVGADTTVCAPPVRIDSLGCLPGSTCGTVKNEKGEALPFANILLVGTDKGTTTDDQGWFSMEGVPWGPQTLKVLYLGYETQDHQFWNTTIGTSSYHFTLVEAIVGEMPMVMIHGKKEIIRKGAPASFHSVGQEDIEKLPVDTFPEALALKSGVVARGGELHFRGGRAGEIEFQIDGIPANGPGGSPDVDSANLTGDVPAPTTKNKRVVSDGGQSPFLADSPQAVRPKPNVPIPVGGSRPVNGRAFDAMFFEDYGTRGFRDPIDDALATFAVDVDRASFTIARNYLANDRLPPKEAVRVEEFVNHFVNDYCPPGDPRCPDKRATTFAVHMEAAPSPFRDGLVSLRVGVKGRETQAEERKPAILTLVIDVSGSMDRQNRLHLAKKSLELLLAGLNANDQVAIVTYGDKAETVLPHTPLSKKAEIRRKLMCLCARGSTNAEDGLVLAYRLAEKAFDENAINRVVLCSDGVANVGNTDSDSILKRIKKEARRGITMTAVGVGMGNYNDVLLEQLADHADGNYYYVDAIEEAQRIFVDDFLSMLEIIARDVKIQVEFDPKVVRGYRLLGYENRRVADKDFRNDRADAGEIGSGHEVTALFELRLHRVRRPHPLATARIRWEDPDTGLITEHRRDLSTREIESSWKDTDASWRTQVTAAEFAEILRKSEWVDGANLERVIGLSHSNILDPDPAETLNDLAVMTRKAAALWPRVEPVSWKNDARFGPDER